MILRRISMSAATLSLILAGCSCIVDDDDDDSIVDDDDDDLPEDDDDAVDDDDDDGLPDFDGITFEFQMDVSAEDVGDDDDSAGGGEERGTQYTVTVQHTINYWIDVQNGIALCTQVMESQAEAWFGFGVVPELGVDESCPQFTGYLEVDPTTVTDLSNPDLDPEHCDPAGLDAVGGNYGRRLLSPADPNATPANYGDFLSFGFLDAETHSILGIELNTNPQAATSADALRAEYEGFGLTYVGAAFLPVTPGSLAAGAGLDQIANPVGSGCDWLAGFELFKNPATNEHVGEDLQGEYGATAGFLLGFNAP